MKNIKKNILKRKASPKILKLKKKQMKINNYIQNKKINNLNKVNDIDILIFLFSKLSIN